MTIDVEVQYVAGPAEVPTTRDIQGWVEAALRGQIAWALPVRKGEADEDSAATTA